MGLDQVVAAGGLDGPAAVLALVFQHEKSTFSHTPPFAGLLDRHRVSPLRRHVFGRPGRDGLFAGVARACARGLEVWTLGLAFCGTVFVGARPEFSLYGPGVFCAFCGGTILGEGE